MTAEELIEAMGRRKCVIAADGRRPRWAIRHVPAAVAGNMSFSVILKSLPLLKVYEPRGQRDPEGDR